MNKLATLFSIGCMALSCATAQSLKPEAPAPLQAGVNRAVADSMVGSQYWYFLSGPGERFMSSLASSPRWGQWCVNR